eukprot:TRINITY_DN29956_c0_g1_i1.p1 TRINITY_DN29956_c0_g1~~TRINITY_DN29956_c0_g1_i1.p1  ORF type:complete len:423 (+),score=77.64 TRINITY_DN29956_c0_g1_i1:68-1336(+)
MVSSVDVLLERYNVPEARVLGVSQMLGRPGIAVVKQLAKRVKEQPSQEEHATLDSPSHPSEARTPQSSQRALTAVSSLEAAGPEIPESSVALQQGEASHPNSRPTSREAVGLGCSLSLAELRRIALPPTCRPSPTASTMSLQSRSLQGAESCSQRCSELDDSRRARKARRPRRPASRSSNTPKGAKPNTTPTQRSRTSTNLEDSLNAAGLGRRASRQIAEIMNVASARKQSEADLAPDLGSPLKELRQSAPQKPRVGSAEKLGGSSPNNRKKNTESNPFVEYEDKELGKIQRITWLQQDPAFMASRTNHLRLEGARQRLSRREAIGDKSIFEIEPESGAALQRTSEKKLRRQQEAAANQAAQQGQVARRADRDFGMVKSLKLLQKQLKESDPNYRQASPSRSPSPAPSPFGGLFMSRPKTSE